MSEARTANGQAGAPRALAFRLFSDERLARLAESGSDAAFAAIYGRYGAMLQGYCRSIVRDDEEARDALQNAMLKALQALRRQSRTGPLRPWLFRIAHNESISLLRTRARRPEVLEDGATRAPDAHRHAEARERLAELLDDLGSLTGHQRGALVMRELGGLGYEEIASALHTSPLAARQAVFSARRNLTAMGEARGRPHGSIAALLMPAPAGAALLATVLATAGGSAAGGSALAIKAVATLATVSIGVGALEVARAPAPPASKQARDGRGAETPHAARDEATRGHDRR